MDWMVLAVGRNKLIGSKQRILFGEGKLGEDL